MLLLRHGQSEWNALGRWQGMADSPLTTVGYDQATATAVVLAAMGVQFGSVWSSDLSRASSTAEVVADALNLTEVLIDTNLREAHAGEWQGLTHADIRRDWPGYLEAHRRPPDFELYESVVARALEALTNISKHPSSAAGAVVVVTHSGLIRSLLRDLAGTDPRVPNLGGAWVDISTGANRISGTVIEMFDPSAFDPAMPAGSADVLGEEPGAATL